MTTVSKPNVSSKPTPTIATPQDANTTATHTTATHTTSMHTAAADTAAADTAAADTVAADVPKANGPALRSFGLRTLFLIMQLVAAAAAGYWWANQRAAQEHKVRLDVPAVKSADDTVPVTIEPVVVRQLQRGIDVVGNLHGYDELTLKTKVSGRVAKVYYDFADRVAPGTLLMEIDPTDAALAVEQARRNLASELAKWGLNEVPAAAADLTALPTVVSARLRAELSKSQLQRLTALQSRGSVSAEELDQARTNALVAESDYANQLQLARSGAATARLRKAELDTAEQHLLETKIYAPQFNTLGPQAVYTITQRLVTPGTWVAAGADLFQLVIDETLKLRLNVPEKHAGRVQVGQRVEISTLAESITAAGLVTRVGAAVNLNTRTFVVEAEIPNVTGQLKTGGFAKARIIFSDASAAQTVPVSALVSFAGVHKLFVLEERAVTSGEPQVPVAKEVQIRLGLQTDTWVEVVDPSLPSDSRVVTSGQSQLANGSMVRIRSSEAPSPTVQHTATSSLTQENRSPAAGDPAQTQGDAP